MRILFLTPRFPYPPIKGDQVIPFHRMRVLAAQHEIHLLSLVSERPNAAAFNEVQKYCRSMQVVTLPRWRSWLRVLSQGPFTNMPLQVLYFQSHPFRSLINEVTARNNIDIVHCFMLRLSPYVAHIAPRVVLELIDSMQLNLERRYSREQGVGKFAIRAELKRIASHEREIASQFENIVVVSNQDARKLLPRKAKIIPLGVDTSLFFPSFAGAPDTIVFSGNMAYAPNKDAVLWFMKSCFLKLKRHVPSLRFIVAGSSPARAIRRLAAIEGVQITGFVPSIADVLRSATVAIAPMQSGSGMQFKILEAMACGLPVVATSLAKGDIGASAEHGLVTTDTAESFANAVLDLLRDPHRAQDMGKAARRYMIANHSWEAGAKRIEELYEQISLQSNLSGPGQP